MTFKINVTNSVNDKLVGPNTPMSVNIIDVPHVAEGFVRLNHDDINLDIQGEGCVTEISKNGKYSRVEGNSISFSFIGTK